MKKEKKKKKYIPSEKMEFKKSYDRVERRVHMINSNILHRTYRYLNISCLLLLSAKDSGSGYGYAVLLQR